MNWTEGETLKAANATFKLSALLNLEGFWKKNAIRWLKPEHISRFCKELDADEADKLHQFELSKIDPKPRSFPLLDWLLILAPSDSWKREYLRTTKFEKPGTGRELIVRLVEFKSDWISSWWRSLSKALNASGGSLALLHSLSHDDISSLSTCSKILCAAIITANHEFFNFIPKDRRGEALLCAMENLGKEYPPLVDEIFQYCCPRDATEAVMWILESKRIKENASRLAVLSNLITASGVSPVSNPVIKCLASDNPQLDSLLRYSWKIARYPSGKTGDDVWKDGIFRLWPVVVAAVSVTPDRYNLELGFSCGVRIAESGRDFSASELSNQLTALGITPTEAIVRATLPMAELWTALRSLAKYQASYYNHKTELIGLRSTIATTVKNSPSLWAQALPWVLVRDSALGDTAQAITLDLASSSDEVYNSLHKACSDENEQLRLIAYGLRALLEGIDDPNPGLARTLADAAAHHMDGTPIFPHPLTPTSATWLGSIQVEQTIANGVKRASQRFAAEVCDQGGDVEEALTKALIKEMEQEFRDVKPRLKLLGLINVRPLVPALSLSQRPTSKKTEEPIYGCDLAWILNATVGGRFKSTWVDIVQVKKSKALHNNREKRYRADSWEIEIKQLENILTWSATAAYWLIASQGEVLVLPAKHLEAIRQGTETKPKARTFTVGYNQVRSAAIPLEQYFVDLLIGQWIGTSSEKTVSFARGENINLRPRTVVEVTISVGREDHQ